MNIFLRNILTIILILVPIISISHEGQDERLKFWKEYYNPKLDVLQKKVPDVKISLENIGPFYQLHTNVSNFKLTPDQDMKNNNTWTGYGKLFINGKFVTRIYNEYLFLKSIPIGENEIKVILSSNMDSDLSYQGNLVSDSIIIRFPEYTFAEARSKAYGLSIQCEFSEDGIKNRSELAKRGLSVSESSNYLKCYHDSQKNTLDSFTQEMTKYQLFHYNISMRALQARIKVWERFEDNEINIGQARKMNSVIEGNIDSEIQKKLESGQ